MALLDELISGSFRGVPFLIENSRTEFGRKAITYEIPGSDRRFIEDLGLDGDKFTIDFVIQFPNYIQKRDRMIQALKEEGSGQLVHPFFGLRQVFALKTSLSEDPNQLGCARFSVSFSESEPNIFPNISDFDFNRVFNEAVNAYNNLQNDISRTFRNSNTINFFNSVNLVDSMLVQFGRVTRPFVSTDDDNNNYLSSFNSFQDNVASVVSQPEVLATRTRDLFDRVYELGNSNRDRFQIAQGFYTFQEDFEKVPPKTFYQQERLHNNNMMINSVNLFSLINGYKAIIGVTFETLDELSNFSTVLEAQFEKVNRLNFEDVKFNENQGDFSDATVNSLIKTKTLAMSALDALRENLNAVVTVTTPTSALLPFVYRNYGSLDNLTEIVKLNNLVDTNKVEGEVEIFQEQQS